MYNDFKEDGKTYIVKLRNSCGSKLLQKIRTFEEFNELKVDLDDIVIQEYIDEESQEYTVGVFSDGRNISTIIFKRQLKHGYINIQLRKHEEKNYIFEINARISGSVYFQYMLGHNIVIWWLDLLDGKPDMLRFRMRISLAIMQQQKIKL